MKKVGVITGATGGLGKEFVTILAGYELDELWVIARTMEKLELLKEEFGDRIVGIPLDLEDSGQINQLKLKLESEQPSIRYLINNAGAGKMGYPEEFSLSEVEQMIDINVKAIGLLCTMMIPYMERGSKVLNISSQASFQPNPYLSLYAATKAFVTSYSRALNYEVKERGILVTVVCPGWVDTELVQKEWNGRVIRFPGIVPPAPVAKKAMRDAELGKDMSVYGTYVKSMRLFSKIFPNKMAMYLWAKSIKKYQ